MVSRPTITCREYSAGRRLLALRHKLNQADLPLEERRMIEEEIVELEKQLGMD